MKAMNLLQKRELHSAWRLTWQKLKRTAYPWMVVAGPTAALQTYLHKKQWDAAELTDWLRDPSARLPGLNLNIEFPWPYLKRQVEKELTHQRAHDIQSQEHCQLRTSSSKPVLLNIELLLMLGLRAL